MSEVLAKLDAICKKADAELAEIDKMPTGLNKIFQRATTLRLYYSEIRFIIKASVVDDPTTKKGEQ